MERAYTKNDSYFGALDFDKVYIFHELVVLLNKKRKRDFNLIDRAHNKGQACRINETTRSMENKKNVPTNRIRTSDLEITA